MKSKTAFSPEVIERVRQESHGLDEWENPLSGPIPAVDFHHLARRKNNAGHPMVADYYNCIHLSRKNHERVAEIGLEFPREWLDFIYAARGHLNFGEVAQWPTRAAMRAMWYAVQHLYGPPRRRLEIFSGKAEWVDE